MDIDDLLERNLKEREQREEDPKVIATTGLLEKAWNVCDIVEAAGGKPYEWMGFLIAKESEPEIARDFIMPPNQDVSGSHVFTLGSSQAASIRELDKYSEEAGEQYVIVGWIHNHGSHPVGHSSTDDLNTYDMLESTFGYTKKPNSKRMFKIGNGAVYDINDEGSICSETEKETFIEYTIPQEDLEEISQKYRIESDEVPKMFNDMLNSSTQSIREVEEKGFCYSIVVNNRRDNPYSEFASKKFGRETGRVQSKKRRAPLFVVEEELQYDPQILIEEVKEKVKFPKKKRF